MPRVKKLNDIAHAQLTLQDLEKGKIRCSNKSGIYHLEGDLNISITTKGQGKKAVYCSFRKKELLGEKRVVFYVVNERLYMQFVDDKEDSYKLIRPSVSSKVTGAKINSANGVKLLSAFAGKWKLKKETVGGELFYYIKLGEEE